MAVVGELVFIGSRVLDTVEPCLLVGALVKEGSVLFILCIIQT